MTHVTVTAHVMIHDYGPTMDKYGPYSMELTIAQSAPGRLS